MRYTLTSKMQLDLMRLLCHMTSSLFPTTLPIIRKEELSYVPCSLFPAIFHLIVLWSHLCALSKLSSRGFFTPPTPPPHQLCYFKSMLTKHKAWWGMNSARLQSCWLHMLHIIIPTINIRFQSRIQTCVQISVQRESLLENRPSCATDL